MKLKFYHTRFFIVLACVCLLFTSFSPEHHIRTSGSLNMLNDILKAIANVKTMRYDLQRTERVKGKMNFTESKVKLQVSPRKLYISLNGQEVLWIQGANNGNALINPGTFPYVNISLDPMGSLMRKNQHHTINELGVAYLGDILKGGIKRYGDKLEKYFVFLGEEKYMGRTCYKLSVSFPDFGWENYTIQKGENILTIAKRLCVSEYMILENNPKVSWYDDVKQGQVVKIPNVYAKIILLMIDKEYMLPISEKIIDDKGLYETYEYFNLKVNSPIAPEEFTKEYKDYKF